MPDRYDDATESLRGMSPPDQWDEITARAAEPDTIVRLDGNEHRGRRRRAPRIAVAAVASAAALAGAVWFVQDDGGDESMISDDPPAEVPEGELQEIPTPCEPLNLMAGDAGTVVFGTPSPADPDDPRVAAELRPHLAGVYPSATTTRALFVLDGRPDIPFTGPTHQFTTIYELEGTVGPFSDGWAVQFDHPVTEGTCPLTLLGVGLTEPEITGIFDLAGLTAVFYTPCDPLALGVGDANAVLFVTPPLRIRPTPAFPRTCGSTWPASTPPTRRTGSSSSPGPPRWPTPARPPRTRRSSTSR